MKKKYSIEIPEFISISKYQELTNMEHLTEIGKMVRTINVFTKIPEDEIKTWAIINDVDYGYTDISTMSLGEFIDLESLCKKPQANLHEIMAVLYRPIKTHRFDKLVWKAKHNVQLMQKKTDNVFKWYTVEEYNNNNRIADSEAMKELPTGFALGALSFFLGTASLYSINSINSSSQVGKMEMEEVKKKTTKQLMEALAAIGDGLVHYIHSPKQAFSISQEKLVSLS